MHTSNRVSVRVAWLGSFSGRAEDGLEAAVRDTFEDFFKYASCGDVSLSFAAFFTKSGVTNETGIKPISYQRGMRVDYPGVPVLVHSSRGTQGVGGLLQLQGMEKADLAQLIEKGPYDKRLKAVKMSCEESSLSDVRSSATCSEASRVTTEVTLNGSQKVTETVTVAKPQQEVQQLKTVPQLSPRQKMESNGVPPEKIRGLQSAFAAIIDSEMRRLGLTELPNTLQVEVPVVTEALIEHLEIVPDKEHGFRGKVGGYYSGWVTLFGLKDIYTHDEVNDRRFWLMDCPLVLDFIGGTDALAHLVRVRQQRKVVPQEPPSEQLPSAEDVEQAVAQGLPYEEVIELARKTLEGKKLAELSLFTAQAQEVHYQLILDALQAQIAQAQQSLDAARASREEAEQYVSSFVLQPDVLERIREMKRQIDALSNELGL